MWLGLPTCDMESTFRASLVVGHQILETVLPGNRCSSFMNFLLESMNINIDLSVGGSCLGCGLVALGCGHLFSCGCVLRGVWARGGRCTASWCVCVLVFSWDWAAGGQLVVDSQSEPLCCPCGWWRRAAAPPGSVQSCHYAAVPPSLCTAPSPLPVLLQRPYLLPQLPHLSLCQCELPAHLAELLFKELCVVVGSEVGQHQLL